MEVLYGGSAPIVDRLRGVGEGAVAPVLHPPMLGFG